MFSRLLVPMPPVRAEESPDNRRHLKQKTLKVSYILLGGEVKQEDATVYVAVATVDPFVPWMWLRLKSLGP